MARATKVYCMFCESKMEAGIPFCSSCGKPTDWASHEQRVAYELQQWRNGRANGNGSHVVASHGVHAPPPPPRRKRAASSSSSPSIERRAGDLVVRETAEPTMRETAEPTMRETAEATETSGEVVAKPVKKRSLFARSKKDAGSPTADASSVKREAQAAKMDAPPVDHGAPSPKQDLEPASEPLPSVPFETPVRAGTNDAPNGNGSWSRLLSREATAKPAHEHRPEAATPEATPAPTAVAKPAATKPAAKRSAPKKAGAKKAEPKQPAAKKASPKKAAAAKNPVAKKPAPAKPAATKPPATKPPAPGKPAAAATPPTEQPVAKPADVTVARETLDALQALTRQMGALTDRIAGLEQLLDQQPAPKRRFFRRT